ncbi:MAG: nucleoside 2-deoxyribosyltransferase [Minisyncoccia bacterium]
MKIYFAGSIRGGREDQEIYFSIIRELGKYGTVLTEHIGEKEITDEGEDSPDSLIFKRDMSWVKEADVIIAEVTTPSLGVGYEIGQAQSMNKPVICIYRKIEGKRLSAMIYGNPYVKILEYSSIEDLINIFEKNLSNLS